MICKDIVLLTHEFPFVSGNPSAESYLGGEINVLARNAERVIVFALEGFRKEWPLRDDLPENVVAFGLEDVDRTGDTSFANRLKRVAGALPLFSEIRSDRGKINSRTRFFEASRFLQLSNGQLKGILRQLGDNCIELAGERTLFYSFWYNEPARTLIKLADIVERQTGKRPVVISRAHGYDCYDYRSYCGYLPFKRWMAERLDAVYACSRNGAEHLRRNNPEVADKFRIGHLGTIGMGVQGERRKCAPFSIVCCSRAVPLKRVNRVIDALSILETRGHRMKFTFIGSGEELERLKNQAMALSSTEVEFTGGLSNERVLEYYGGTHTDLFVNASEVEGIPLSIMEAQSFGIPAIATNVGGNSEIVLDGICGSLIDGDFSDEELADLIERYIVMGDEATVRMRAASRKNWESSFRVASNVESIMGDVEALFLER